jgi:hypothetical protein
MRQTIFILAIALLGASAAFGQNQPVRELGVRLNGLNLGGYNDFSVVYKKQKANGKYARWRAAYGEFNGQYLDQVNNFGLGFTLSYGVEKRKELNPKFDFIRGPEAGIGFSLNTARSFSPRTNTSFRLGYILGLQYQISKTFFVNLETIPSASISLSTNGDKESWGLGAVAISNAALTLGCRF